MNTRQLKIHELEQQICDTTDSVRHETEALESQRHDLLTKINKVKF